jgi:hypothetical protein
MNKSELLRWLQQEHQQWEALLQEVSPDHMEEPGVNGEWSMKDVVAHLTGWNRRLVAHMQAAQRGESEPPPPWPGHLQTEDEINAWIYESNRDRPLDEALDESRQSFRQILAMVERLPEDVRIEQVHEPGRVFHLVWVNEERFLPGEFFDHFHDDHEPDIRAWLAQGYNQ